MNGAFSTNEVEELHKIKIKTKRLIFKLEVIFPTHDIFVTEYVAEIIDNDIILYIIFKIILFIFCAIKDIYKVTIIIYTEIYFTFNIYNMCVFSRLF